MLHRLLLLASLLLATACATPLRVAGVPAACPAGFAARDTITAFFGRNAKGFGGEHERVSDADWAGFHAREILPRFPRGSTTLDAVGSWQGQHLPERTKVLLLVLPPAEAADALHRLDQAIAIYQRDFQQQSVGVLATRGCARGLS